MEIEIGLVVAQIARGREWEVVSPSSRTGYWNIVLLSSTNDDDAMTIGRHTGASTDWFDNYCTVARRPSIAGPIGDGVMFAFIHTDTQFTQRLQLEGSAETLIEWITEQCGRLASPTCKTVTVEWWGYDAQIYDDFGEVIGLDLEPDMVATWELEHEELVWRES